MILREKPENSQLCHTIPYLAVLNFFPPNQPSLRNLTNSFYTSIFVFTPGFIRITTIATAALQRDRLQKIEERLNPIAVLIPNLRINTAQTRTPRDDCPITRVSRSAPRRARGKEGAPDEGCGYEIKTRSRHGYPSLIFPLANVRVARYILSTSLLLSSYNALSSRRCERCRPRAKNSGD